MCLPCSTFGSITSSSPQISTLQSVHRQGICIIRCDVKSENVVTTTTESFYLIDWGSARRKTDPIPHDPLGTPAFKSLHVLNEERTLGHTFFLYSAHKYHLVNNEQDDLESHSYTLLFAADGRLPWKFDRPRKDQISRSRRAKRKVFSTQTRYSDGDPDICRFDQYVCHPYNTGLCSHPYHSPNIEDSVYEDLTTLLNTKPRLQSKKSSPKLKPTTTKRRTRSKADSPPDMSDGCESVYSESKAPGSKPRKRKQRKIDGSPGRVQVGKKIDERESRRDQLKTRPFAVYVRLRYLSTGQQLTPTSQQTKEEGSEQWGEE